MLLMTLIKTIKHLLFHEYIHHISVQVISPHDTVAYHEIHLVVTPFQERNAPLLIL